METQETVELLTDLLNDDGGLVGRSEELALGLAIQAIKTVDAVNAYLGGLGPKGAAPDVILRKVLELVSA